MSLLKNIFRVFWKIWFYAWVILTIVAISPVLFIIISNEKNYKTYYKIARFWGKTILFVMGFPTKIDYDQKTDPNKSYLFIANHTSLVDIMLVLVAHKNPTVFVGKKEILKYPVFGYVFRKTSIWVDRSSPKSRKDVYDRAQHKLNQGLSIVLFPEGGVPDENVVLDRFKNGAFRLAIEHQIPIVPMTFYNVKKHFPWPLFSGWPGKLRVKVHPFIETKGLNLEDREKIKQEAHSLIYNELISDTKKLTKI